MEIRNHPLVKKLDDIKYVIGIILFFLAIPYVYFLPDSNNKSLKVEEENISIELPESVINKLNSKNLTKIKIENLTHEDIKKIRIELKSDQTEYLTLNSSAKSIHDNSKELTVLEGSGDYVFLKNLHSLPPYSITTLYLWGNNEPKNLYDSFKNESILITVNDIKIPVFKTVKGQYDLKNFSSNLYGVSFLLIFVIILILVRKRI